MGSAVLNNVSEFSSQIKVSPILSLISGVLVSLIILLSFPSILVSRPNSLPISSSSLIAQPPTAPQTELSLTTVYDDPEVSYLMDKPVKNWDQKRRQWLASHPTFLGSAERFLIVTGSQPNPCESPIGDHLMLRLFKNKVDYCRIHGCDVFYNNVLLHPKMFHYWAKYPVIKAAMVAHPEAEWIWWIDVDAVFTDMDFDLPLEKYKSYNLIAYGWPEAVTKHKSSMGLNAGVFLIRNCQWSMDLLDKWADFGPQSSYYEMWGKVQQAIFVDKEVPVSDDQAALAYLIMMEKEGKIYLENDYYFQGYWIEIVERFENMTRNYADIEKKVAALRGRHAEKAGEGYRSEWKQYLDSTDTGGYSPYTMGSWRRPFVTHFTGCEPCSGNHNPIYPGDSCSQGIIRALNFADNQVLRNFGYTRRDINATSVVEPLSFDFPA